jgi:Tol biopolymer transport system component
MAAICAVFVLSASAAEVLDGRIAFSGYDPGKDSYELYSANPDGSDLINLTRRFGNDARGPVYSPDGRWIAFGCAEFGERHRPTPTDVCLVKDAAKKPKVVRLTDMKGYDFPWAFSPDSERILFTADDGVFEMERNGTGITRLTDPDMDADSAAYTPDGERIVFDSYEGNLTGGLYVMDADGSNLTSITDRSVFKLAYGPSMSPDGTQIAFLADLVSEAGDDRELFVSDLQGGNIVRLTSNTLDEGYPAFSPDGDLIAYVAGGQRLVWTVRPDGTHNEVAVETGAFNLESFGWAPSGDRLAVEMKHVGSDIGTAALGGTPHRITKGGVKEESPAWAVKR